MRIMTAEAENHDNDSSLAIIRCISNYLQTTVNRRNDNETCQSYVKGRLCFSI